MTTLKHLLTQPLRAVPTSSAILVLVVALLGFADATYLTVEHFMNVIPPCSVTSGCETVLTSSYSVVFGIPVSLLGSIFYLLVLVGTAIYLESRDTRFFKWSLLVTVFGFFASLVFIYLQVFVIHSYCIYCLGSALTSTVLFVVAMRILAVHQLPEKV